MCLGWVDARHAGMLHRHHIKDITRSISMYSFSSDNGHILMLVTVHLESEEIIIIIKSTKKYSKVLSSERHS